MFVKRLRLENFRNYTSVELSLDPGVNLIHGKNGQGKTNLVEAINYFSSLTSHRVSGNSALINQFAKTAVLAIEISHQEKNLLLEFEINKEGANRARLNRQAVKPRDVLGYLNSVIFAPEDLDIVKRDPSNRRAFLDTLIVQLSPRMHGVMSDYERVLKQRNTLLKTARQTGAKGSALTTLSAWDKSLVEFGSEIISQRVMLMNRLTPFLLSAYRQISESPLEPRMFIKSSILGSTIYDGDESDDTEYLESPDREEIEKIFSEKLERLRPKELERGITLVGPHRDELVLILGTLPAKGYASHGECWSYALALRLASLELLRSESNLGDPVLILDDVFAELDSSRRKKLAELVKENEQVLITAAVIDDVPAELIAKRFSVTAGVVTNG
jgi:DNA replication and repair protein RecF